LLTSGKNRNSISKLEKEYKGIADLGILKVED
jgi:hypothetical protein